MATTVKKADETCNVDFGATSKDMAGIARVSLLVRLISTLLSLAAVIPLDATVGCIGDRIDFSLMRFTEFFQTVLTFALAIVLVEILKSSVMAAIAIVSWPPVAGLVRGELLSLRSRDYVQAAIVASQTSG